MELIFSGMVIETSLKCVLHMFYNRTAPFIFSNVRISPLFVQVSPILYGANLNIGANLNMGANLNTNGVNLNKYGANSNTYGANLNVRLF